ncbi:MAG: formate dehydrogenase subunit delta [Rhodanobacteraceae bacterium]|nr:formate dehydrogenase subunit delta [Rhodanobacteraceae bacterium]
MANDIAHYFASEPEHDAAVSGIRSHIQRFWEPRMRAALIAHCRDTSGSGLHELAREAVMQLANKQ